LDPPPRRLAAERHRPRLRAVADEARHRARQVRELDRAAGARHQQPTDRIRLCARRLNKSANARDGSAAGSPALPSRLFHEQDRPAMDGSTAGLRRQHLIDPEVCIRCNTCEEVCSVHAISHNGVNYVVDFDKCEFCGDCLPPCPTGAIDSYRQVARPWTLAEQLGWESLPSDATPGDAGAPIESPVPAEVATITAAATAAEEGRAVPPWSAAHPYINLYQPERPVIATVSGNLRLTEPGTSSEIHHIVLDLGTTAFPLLEGQSIGVLPPGLDAEGKPHRVRLYSVASPREGERPGKNN